MQVSLQKEQFSLAYLHAVATVAGFSLSDPRIDEDSIDVTISAKASRHTPRRPKLDVQLKCTASDVLLPDGLHFRLERKNYEELRPDGDDAPIVPHILVVLVVPADSAEWLLHTEQELTLRNCAYWRSLKGAPSIKDTQDKVTIHIPRQQMFTPEALQALMQRVNDRSDL